MCFSAPVSFTAGVVLVAAGAVCVKKTVEKDKSYLLFALVPLLFGVQQLIEGFVWIGLLQNHPLMVKFFSLAFVFFAFTVWPAFAPLSVYLVEKKENPATKRVLLVTAVIGMAAGLASFVLLMPGYIAMTTKIVGHSISYDTDVPELLKVLFFYLYLLSVIPPFLIISNRKLKLFGYLLILSVIFSDLIFRATVASVWCFFAALLSLYIARVVYTLP